MRSRVVATKPQRPCHIAGDAKSGTPDQKFRRKANSDFARDVNVGEHTVNIPARPFTGLKKDGGTTIIGIADDWLRG
jgi:phage gpG-like protein